MKYPAPLHFVDFVRVRFGLEFQETYLLTLEAALRLRRNLRQALDPSESAYFQPLLDPPLSPDPQALRRYQRPSPLFAIMPPMDLPRNVAKGDTLDLEVVFWGRGSQLLSDFVLMIQTLGRVGWHRGEGRFELVHIEGIGPAGDIEPIWSAGRSPFHLAPPVLSAAWWLESHDSPRTSLQLVFDSPARMLAGGRPLFRSSFTGIFPFFLRRVTSMVHACCDIDLIGDPEPLLKQASKVREVRNTLRWSDWRTLEGENSCQDLGGIIGSVLLEGESLPEVFWVLALASMMNVGKGASYGAGHFRVEDR